MKDEVYAREIIKEMEQETKSKSAKKRMAQLAISAGNYTPNAKAVWAEYLAAM